MLDISKEMNQWIIKKYVWLNRTYSLILGKQTNMNLRKKPKENLLVGTDSVITLSVFLILPYMRTSPGKVTFEGGRGCQ
jgi:hypothetical protein